MIQDIFPHKLDNHFRPDAKAGPDDLVMPWNGKAFLAAADFDDQSLQYPKVSDLACGDPADLVYLFTIDRTGYYLLRCEADARPEDILKDAAGYAFYTLQDLRRSRLEPRLNVFAAFTGYHLADWYDANRYCGWCGAKTEYDKAERAMRCPVCDHVEYPRINPAVIIGVTNGDKLLIIRYRVGYGGGALVAGFTEIGETLEGTVEREVMEEVGLKVKNIRYYKSQPWGIAADILAGFFCDLDGDDTIRIDENELKYAEWVRREDIEPQKLDYSLTGEMMMLFKNGGEPR
jgi:NAD+ diphosphatase